MRKEGTNEQTKIKQCSILTERYWSELVENAHVPIKSFGLPCLFWNVLREISVEMDKV